MLIFCVTDINFFVLSFCDDFLNLISFEDESIIFGFFRGRELFPFNKNLATIGAFIPLKLLFLVIELFFTFKEVIVPFFFDLLIFSFFIS